MTDKYLSFYQQHIAQNQHGDKPPFITILHIGELQSKIIYGNQPVPLLTNQLNLGYVSLAQRYFQRGITPLAIENMIVEIEDELMSVARALTVPSQLYTLDQEIMQIGELSSDISTPDGMTLSIEAMESVFNRFADIASGRPTSSDSLPFEANFATTLLILREFMHHLLFNNIYIAAQK